MKRIAYFLLIIAVVFVGIKVYFWERNLVTCGGEEKKKCPPGFVCDFGRERLVPLPDAYGTCRLQFIPQKD